ncbi:uncharacterized protein RAG0_15887 [Rhynchosporium agropyri]|uniref:Uncharacterized protein n=1 Tax=Rhynchosporium agropyri TaxID=914238 RepID=A0A1E1LN09_9HELO|nr:uncharacterized protein RAG0_15887 [Rhynchosporium agropyri]
MRLLKFTPDGNLSLTEFSSHQLPQYAILSHTWGKDGDEVTSQEIPVDPRNKAGYAKIEFCGKRAAEDGLEYFWVDTCCIDKTSSAELQEAIGSMFRWYRDSTKCYVYLTDVLATGDLLDPSLQPWQTAFRKSRWFSRGWTLQELIAPLSVEFFSSDGKRLGDKQSLKQQLHKITGIAISALQGGDLLSFSVPERLTWAETRQTKREEDEAYSLFGIFDVRMSLDYGEGKATAFERLQEEICKHAGKRQRDEVSLIEQLYFTKIDERLTSLTAAQGKTCRWFLTTAEYISWNDTDRRQDHGGFLWIKGHPGTGKSTLMKLLFEEKKLNTKHDPSRIILSFFFLARGNIEEKSITGLYRSLLHQLFAKQVDLRETLEWMTNDGAKIVQRNGWSEETLKQTMVHAIKKLGSRSLTIFVDALDECDTTQTANMVAFFEELCDLAEDSQVRLQSKPAESLRSELLEKSSSIFLWVVLVLDILNSEYPDSSGSIKKIRDRLKEILQTLTDLFELILIRDGDNLDRLQICLMWILFAARPMKPEELYPAVQFKLDKECSGIWDEEDMDLDQMKYYVRSSSKGLAEVNRNEASEVQFIHESVNVSVLLDDSTLPNIINATQLRETISPFLGYSIHNILHHANIAQQNKIIQGDFLHHFPVERWTVLSSFLEKYEVRRYRGVTVGLLYILAGKNLADLIQIHSGRGSAFLIEDQRYGCPLFAALATSSKEAVEAMLEAQLADTPTSSQLRIFLGQSCHDGHPWLKQKRQTEVIPRAKTIFERGFIFSQTKSVFHYIKENRVEVLIAFYLINVADVDFREINDTTPLSWAVDQGYDSAVKVLLEKEGVDVNSRDHGFSTPLLIAVSKRNRAIVSSLLGKKGVDVNATNFGGRSPLCQAIEQEDAGIVKLFLPRQDIRVNYRTPSAPPVLHH